MNNAMIKQLDLVEQQFNQVAAFLASGQAPQVETASQALQVVVPTAPGSTYSGGSAVYGTVGRQVGVHKFLAA